MRWKQSPRRVQVFQSELVCACGVRVLPYTRRGRGGLLASVVVMLLACAFTTATSIQASPTPAQPSGCNAQTFIARYTLSLESVFP